MKELRRDINMTLKELLEVVTECVFLQVYDSNGNHIYSDYGYILLDNLLDVVLNKKINFIDVTLSSDLEVYIDD